MNIEKPKEALPSTRPLKIRKLQTITYACGKVISQDFQRRVKLSSYTDPFTHDLMVSAHIKVWGEVIKEQKNITKTYDTYASWWQMFKAKYFPIWLKQWFPIRFCKRNITIPITIYHNTLYPDYNPILGKAVRQVEVYES